MQHVVKFEVKENTPTNTFKEWEKCGDVVFSREIRCLVGIHEAVEALSRDLEREGRSGFRFIISSPVRTDGGCYPFEAEGMIEIREKLERHLIYAGLAEIIDRVPDSVETRKGGVFVATEVYPISWRLDAAREELEAGNLDEVHDYLSEIRRELDISILHNRPMPPVPLTVQVAAVNALQ